MLTVLKCPLFMPNGTLTPERPGTERTVEKIFRVKYDMLASF